MQNNTKKSYLAFISSMLVFSTIGIFRRYIPLSSGLLAFARGVMGAVVLCLFVKIKGGTIRHSIGKKNFWLLALSGALMGANWIFLFEAYNYTTVGIATLCYYMQPTIVIILSPIIFREKLSLKGFFCAAISIVGMVFVSGVMDGASSLSNNFKGIVFGLCAAALYASVVILNKKVFVDDSYEKTIIQLSSAAIVMIPYLLLTERIGDIEFTTFAVVMLLIVGIVHTGISYALYFSSMRNLKAQSIAVLSYIDPVVALILSAVILGERLSIFGLAGAVMIIGAALISEL